MQRHAQVGDSEESRSLVVHILLGVTESSVATNGDLLDHWNGLL